MGLLFIFKEEIMFFYSQEFNYSQVDITLFLAKTNRYFQLKYINGEHALLFWSAEIWKDIPCMALQQDPHAFQNFPSFSLNLKRLPAFLFATFVEFSMYCTSLGRHFLVPCTQNERWITCCVSFFITNTRGGLNKEKVDHPPWKPHVLSTMC